MNGTKYLAFDAISGDYADFNTIAGAKRWLQAKASDGSGGYVADFSGSRIYEVKLEMGFDVVDRKSGYKYDEENAPDDADVADVWPYHPKYEEIITPKFTEL